MKVPEWEHVWRAQEISDEKFHLNGSFSHSHLGIKLLRCFSLSSACSRLIHEIRAPLFILLLVHPVYVKLYSCLLRLRDFRAEGALSFIHMGPVPGSILIRREL